MNKANKINLYGVKEVPDLYVCNKNGDVLYYSETLTRVDLYPTTDGSWRCFIETPIGNLEDWYNLPYDKQANLFYFRTFKRNKNTGEDESLCFVISPEKIIPQGFYFKAGEGPFRFPVVFTFKPERLIFIENEDCPKKQIDLIEKTTKFKFAPPKKNYKQIKIELVQKTVMELKEKSKRNKLNQEEQ